MTFIEALLRSRDLTVKQAEYAAVHGRTSDGHPSYSTLRMACRMRVEEPDVWRELLAEAPTRPAEMGDMVPSSVLYDYFQTWADPAEVGRKLGMKTMSVVQSLRRSTKGSGYRLERGRRRPGHVASCRLVRVAVTV